MQDFTQLRGWERAHRLALRVYSETHSWRRGHGALASQARRAAMSVGANISEGCGKESRREFARFLEIARGSTSELENHMRFARDLALLSPHVHRGYVEEIQAVRRMLTALLGRLRASTDD